MKAVGTVPPPNVGLVRIDVSIAQDGGALFLDRSAETFAPHRCEIVHSNWGVESRYPLSNLPSAPFRAQIFPSGKLLLLTLDGHKEVAAIYEQDGQRIVNLPIGEFVEDIQIDEAGRVWVSHFDQKGFSAPALACFSEHGQALASFANDILDAYAINASQRRTYLYGYTDFDVLEIDANFDVRKFKTPIRGSRAVAAARGHFLFSNQYREPPEIAHLLRASAGSLVDHEVVELTRPDEQPLNADARLIGRGSALHCFDRDSWHSVDLNELA